jgi:hypothetical protein
MVLNMIAHREILIKILPQTRSTEVDYSLRDGDGEDIGEVGGATGNGSGGVCPSNLHRWRTSLSLFWCFYRIIKLLHERKSTT